MLSNRELEAIESLTTVGNFRSKIEDLHKALAARAVGLQGRPSIVYGGRSQSRQLVLYAQGREQISKTPPPYGTWHQVGRVVTKALPPESAHCYAAASDVALIDEHGHWLPDDHSSWGVLAERAEALGLVSGHRWRFKDSAHVELPNWRQLAAEGTLVLLA